jgi:hypothetical protein
MAKGVPNVMLRPTLRSLMGVWQPHRKLALRARAAAFERASDQFTRAVSALAESAFGQKRLRQAFGPTD